MATDEQGLIDELRRGFEARWPLGVWRKLHGSPFQAGLPDVLCATDVAAALVEFKWLREDADWNRPLAKLVAKLLTANQLSELASLGALDGPLRARVLIGGEVTAPQLSHPATFALGADAVDLLSIRGDLSCADLAANALDGLESGQRRDMTVCAQYQVRPRGGQFHAGYLLFGCTYYPASRAQVSVAELRALKEETK